MIRHMQIPQVQITKDGFGEGKCGRFSLMEIYASVEAMRDP